MTASEMWNAFCAKNPKAAEQTAEAWCYGSDQADELARLTAEGVKTATASAYALYELEKEPLPRAGDYNVILRTDGCALCITKTTRVYVTAYCDVTQEHAWMEGEGDRSLGYWQEVHEAFFREELSAAGLTFTPDMPVVCEEFEVVFK